MISSSSGIVLKRFPYGDTSIICRCFTAEFGKMSFIIHGARRKNSPMTAFLQPMNYVDLVFYYKQTRALQTVSKVEYKIPWLKIKEDLKKITYGFALVELTDKCIIEGDAHKDLFRALVLAISGINSRSEQLNLVFWHYQYQLLTILGFRPDYEHGDVNQFPLPDPFSTPTSKAIFTAFKNGDPGLDRGLSITAVDRKVVSEYLNVHLGAHFDGVQKLKSLQMFRDLPI